ncbi:hypothetical protein ACOMHN_019804 [Nucella lapillus]
MGKCWIGLLLLSLCSDFAQTVSQNNRSRSTDIPTLTPPNRQSHTQSPTPSPKTVPLEQIHLTLKAESRSVHVQWNPPTHNLALIDSYRVRIYHNGRERQVVHWLPGQEGTSKTIACLEPSMQYKVQVMTRFHTGTNITESNSDIKAVSTLSDPGFLSQVWTQRVYVMIGAIIMALLVLFFTPCVCCCYARKQRRRRLDSESVDRKKHKDPRGTEMEDRRRPSDPEDHYTVDPVQGLSYSIRPTFGFSTNQRSPIISHTSPPPYLQAGSTFSEHVPMPEPLQDDVEGSDPDETDYQNNVFGPGPVEDDLYANQSFILTPPRREPSEPCLYGNVQY